MFSAMFAQLKQFFPDIASDAKISFDSRKCAPGDVFFAMKGNATDGRLFIQDALDSGAYVVCDAIKSPVDLNLVPRVHVVDDVKRTISDIVVQSINDARKRGCKSIGVTGSSGKTFTKDAINNILGSAGYTSYCTAGNYNTEFGILLSLAKCPERVDYIVFELGISKPGDMDVIAGMVRPDMCLILDVSEAHMANFSSREALVAEKLKLVLYTSARVVVHKNLQNDLRRLYNRDAIFYNPDDVLDENRIVFQGNIYVVNPRYIRGRHFLENLIGIVYLLEGIVAIDQIIGGFENLEILRGRGNIITLVNPKNNAEFILYDSSYNANPGPNGSMLRELQAFSNMVAPHKIALLGQYGEIDQNPGVYNDTLSAVVADEILVVGSHWPVQNIADKIDETNVDSIVDMVLYKLQPGSVLFVKGSNSNGLYQYFVPRLLAECSGALT